MVLRITPPKLLGAVKECSPELVTLTLTLSSLLSRNSDFDAAEKMFSRCMNF
jgi:hypothetical protein